MRLALFGASGDRTEKCPYDGGYHHHGCIHYDCGAGKDAAARAGIVFRKGSWGLMCDRHYASLVEAK